MSEELKQIVADWSLPVVDSVQTEVPGPTEPDYQTEASDAALALFQSHQQEMVRGVALLESLESLSRQYAEGEYTQTSFENYQSTITHVLNVSGFDLPSGLVVPSFEAVENKETTVKDKAKGVLAAVIKWIKDRIAQLKAFITSKVTASKAGTAKLTARVGEASTHAKEIKPQLLGNASESKSEEASKTTVAIPEWMVVSGKFSKSKVDEMIREFESGKSGERLKGEAPGGFNPKTAEDGVLDELLKKYAKAPATQAYEASTSDVLGACTSLETFVKKLLTVVSKLEAGWNAAAKQAEADIAKLNTDPDNLAVQAVKTQLTLNQSINSALMTHTWKSQSLAGELGFILSGVVIKAA